MGLVSWCWFGILKSEPAFWVSCPVLVLTECSVLGWTDHQTLRAVIKRPQNLSPGVLVSENFAEVGVPNFNVPHEQLPSGWSRGSH